MIEIAHVKDMAVQTGTSTFSVYYFKKTVE